MPKIVEVRLGCTMHELTEEQVFGLLRNFDDHETSVGLGYAGEASVVILDVPDDQAGELGEQVADVAHLFLLDVSLVEVLDPDAYEARALAEVPATDEDGADA